MTLRILVTVFLAVYFVGASYAMHLWGNQFASHDAGLVAAAVGQFFVGITAGSGLAITWIPLIVRRFFED